MFRSSSSLQKCTKHTSINHTLAVLLPDVNIYGINTVKQLLVIVIHVESTYTSL